jgi:hypothetical protein
LKGCSIEAAKKILLRRKDEFPTPRGGIHFLPYLVVLISANQSSTAALPSLNTEADICK